MYVYIYIFAHSVYVYIASNRARLGGLLRVLLQKISVVRVCMWVCMRERDGRQVWYVWVVCCVC